MEEKDFHKKVESKKFKLLKLTNKQLVNKYFYSTEKMPVAHYLSHNQEYKITHRVDFLVEGALEQFFVHYDSIKNIFFTVVPKTKTFNTRISKNSVCFVIAQDLVLRELLNIKKDIND